MIRKNLKLFNMLIIQILHFCISIEILLKQDNLLLRLQTQRGSGAFIYYKICQKKSRRSIYLTYTSPQTPICWLSEGSRGKADQPQRAEMQLQFLVTLQDLCLPALSATYQLHRVTGKAADKETTEEYGGQSKFNERLQLKCKQNRNVADYA